MAGQEMVRTMMRCLKTAIFLTASLLLSYQPALGTTGSGISVGAFVTGAVGDTVIRERVELVGKGNLISGWPKHDWIKLVTVYAPGFDSGHLILSDLKRPEGGRLLLLSAPESLSEKILRVTIYVKHASKNLVLLEYTRGNWQQRSPQFLTTATVDGHRSLQEDLLAFSTEGLGLYWLLDRGTPSLSVSSFVTAHPSASQLLGGGMSGALSSWIWPVLLLVVGWMLSRQMHKIERNTGQ